MTPPKPVPDSVDHLQRWMFEAVTHPGGLDSGLAAVGLPDAGLEGVVLPSDTLTAFDRLEIYADMYFLRLIDIMADEYPTVVYLLGDDLFRAQCRLFLRDHPSRSYQLNRLSPEFPGWLAQRPTGEIRHQAFAVDLARVERAMEDIFDAPEKERIAPEAVAEIGPDQWADTRLEVIPAHRALTLDHPVTPFMDAARQDRHEDVPEPPDAGSASEPCHVLVWRQSWRVWRKHQHPAQAAILGALATGAPLGEAVQSAAADLPGVDPAWLIARLGEWFSQWAQDGLFCGVGAPTGRDQSLSGR